MFLDFFYTLRRHKIPVAITEWRVLMQALSMGFAQASLTRFYTLARKHLAREHALTRYQDRGHSIAARSRKVGAASVRWSASVGLCP